MLFFSGQFIKAYSPPPQLSGQKNGYKFIKNTEKKNFPSGQPLTPPPLSGLTTKKNTFILRLS